MHYTQKNNVQINYVDLKKNKQKKKKNKNAQPVLN